MHRYRADLTWLLIHQYGSFNSPVWFNVRRWKRGFKGNGGNYAYDFKTNLFYKTTNSFERPQCSACFIIKVEDNLVDEGGIMQTYVSEARLFKYGSGSGINFSPIREKDATLGPGGKASGVMSFLDVGDVVAKHAKSGGTTRRAAKMVCLDVDHPEIESFIEWKSREEHKAKVLIANGYADGLDGEAYRTVSGQNSNNSVRVSDKFMHAVINDLNWNLTSRIDGRVVAVKKARDIWRKIAEASWACADPGLQYDTTINEWNTCSNTGRINASNPCSEYMHLDNTACNLASLRLTKFVTTDLQFDTDFFKKAVEVFTIAQDILVDYSSYPTLDIAKGAHAGRQLGLGFADLGALLMQKGIPYDSVEGRALAGGITSLMCAVAYQTSIELASIMGPFSLYSDNVEPMLKVLNKHLKHAQGLTDPVGVQSVDIWKTVIDTCKEPGIRNSQVTVLAPTGTIGFMMDCDTTGIEPLLGHVQVKDLAGGGRITIINSTLSKALRNPALNYDENTIKQLIAHVEKTGGITDAPGFKPEHSPIFQTAFVSGVDPTLSVEAHYLMMAAVQPFLSGAISKTVNLPNTCTVEDIEKIHMMCWKLGLKSVAVYRDGCKTQPVNTKKINNTAQSIDQQILHPPTDPIFKQFQKKLPKLRKGNIYALKIGRQKIFVTIGEYPDGTPGEVWVDIAKDGSTIAGLVKSYAKAISIAIQYGTPIDELIETFSHTNFPPNGMVENHPTIKQVSSIPDLIVRILAVDYFGREEFQHVHLENTTNNTKEKRYKDILDIDAPPCPDCGTITIRNGSCHRCPQCGISLGCS
jgi:ribonucleoside-diphosphate reductase alpha chain